MYIIFSDVFYQGGNYFATISFYHQARNWSGKGWELSVAILGPDAVLSVSRKKISEILSAGPFFHVLQIKCLLKCPCVKGTLMRI